MLFMLSKEQEKYLVPILGNGWNCIVEKTPPEIIKTFKELNALVSKMSDEPEPIHFV